MVAHRTYLRCFLAYDDMAAVTANPHCVPIAREHDAFLYVLKQAAITLLMMTLDSCYCAEPECDFRETLLVGLICHAVIHVCPLEVLSFGRVAKVRHSVGDFAAMKQFIP